MKFYYADGSTFEGEWEDAPGWMVQVIIFDDGSPSPAMRHQGGYYRLENGEPVGMDLTDLLQYVVEELKLIKVGYMMGTKAWKELHDRANRERSE